MNKLAQVINDKKQVSLGYEEYKDFYLEQGYSYQDVEQSDKDNNWYLVGYAPMKTEADKEAEYRAKVDALYMTVGDFNGVLISQFGTNLTALRTVVLQYLDGSEYTLVEKELFMNSFDNALNFYRKHPLFNELAGQPPLNVTEEQWDMVFIEVARAKGEWVD